MSTIFVTKAEATPLKVVIIIIYTVAVWFAATAYQNMICNLLQCATVRCENSCLANRLAEADQNWQRSLQERTELETYKPLDNTYMWDWDNGISVWDFFYPTFDCPHTVERIGSPGNEGAWVCGLNHIAKNSQDCRVYSYGDTNVTHFEETILSRTNCIVHIFKSSIDYPSTVALMKKYHSRVVVERAMLGQMDGAGAFTLKTQMDLNQHKFLDILKIDTGAELEFAVHKMIEDFPLGLPFGQLVVDLNSYFFIREGQTYPNFKQWFEQLESIGLRLFRSETKLFKRREQLSIQYSFINTKTDNMLLHSNEY